MATKLRVLVITALYPPYHLGGYDLRCRDVTEHLRARGHQVRVITTTHGVDRRQIESEVARVLHLSPSKGGWERIRWDVQDLRFLKQEIDTYRPHVVHLWHTAKLTRALFPFLARLSVPVVYDEGGIGLILAWRNHGGWFAFCEGEDRTRLPRRLKKSLCQLLSVATGGVLPHRWDWPSHMHIYFNSCSGLERARSAGVPVDRARVVYSGIDLAKFPFRGRTQIGQHISLLVPGRIHPEKGAVDALAALAILARECRDILYEMDFAGPAHDLEYQTALKEHIANLGLADQVRFLGLLPYETMTQVYHRAHVCLLLTRIPEGFSRVPLEAMASGAIVVTTATGGVSEAVRDGETGFVVPPAAPRAVAAIIKRLIDDQSLYCRVVEQARREVEKRFGLGRAVDEIEQVLLEAAHASILTNAGLETDFVPRLPLE